MFFPVYPISVSILASLNRYASLIWLCGVIFLWLTRYTHQLGRRYGKIYYIFSILTRPLGILLITFGWMAVFSPFQMGDRNYTMLGFRPIVVWFPRNNAIDVLCYIAIALFFVLFIWSVFTLGFRRSFLYRHIDDILITKGPYSFNIKNMPTVCQDYSLIKNNP